MKTSLQVASILSRFFAVGVGLVQSVVILKLLSVGDFGLVKLATSIGATVGVYQNLGLSSGSTREISAANGLSDAFKVFVGSTLVRYCITLPLIIGLYLSSDYISINYYNAPEISLPLKLISLMLLIQAFQSTLNSVVQGLKKFKFLFYFQAIISLVSLLLFVPFLYRYEYIGYFYASLAFTIISTFVLLLYVLKLFNVKITSLSLKDSNIVWPNLIELKSIFKAVFSIGVFVYVVKIIYTQWQNLGPIVLANNVSAEMLGIFGFAVLVASKIATVSDAITDVTLPQMTESFKSKTKNFGEIFNAANTKAYFFILFSAITLVILKKDLFYLVDIIFSFLGKNLISDRYSSAFDLMDPLILAFWGYSHLNLLKSGLAIPVKKLKVVIIAYTVMFITTVLHFMVLPIEPLMSFSISMGIGGLAGYLCLIILIAKEVGFIPITRSDIIYTILSVVLLVFYYLGINKYIVFSIFLIISTYFFDLIHQKEIFKKLLNKIKV